MWHLAQKRYNSSAKGAVSSQAWGNAPGLEKNENISAESAIHSRANSVHHRCDAAIA
jgi:hypothetical protein